MRVIEYQVIVDAVADMCVQASHELPADVLAAIESAMDRESSPRARGILNALLENARIARCDLIPICQDTGVAVVFAEVGAEVSLVPGKENTCAAWPRSASGHATRGQPHGVASTGHATLTDAINDGIALGYEKGYLRKSIVAEPLHRRENTKTNTPAIIHYQVVPGDKLELTVMPKGGGCENKSQFRMFKPTAAASDVKDWVVEIVRAAGADACPPFVVGVGLGGNFEQACILAKKALLRSLDSRNPEPFYAKLETEMLAGINALGIGPQGLGGDTTALGLMIETAPCHIASLPAAVNIECHAHRHASMIL
jgi:fumarate hydratase subunit alpha